MHSSKYSLSKLIISQGSMDKGLVSQQFINKASGIVFILGVLINGLVLKQFQRPDSTKVFLISSAEEPILNSIKSSLLEISISIDKNFLLSPLFIDLTIPPAGAVKKTPIFFLSSNNFWPALTFSFSLTSIVGFIPTKSLPNKETDEIFGSSVINMEGLPDMGKSRPFDILITISVP